MKRIAILGGGLIGARHVAEVMANPRAELVGLVDPNPTPKVPVEVARFDSTEGLALDGVILATPTSMHAGQGIAAARNGWHLLIEKPVAESVADAQALAEAVADAGVGSLVGHHRRYHARVGQLRTLLAEGVIGTPVTATAIWAMRKPDDYFQDNWRSDAGSPVMINLVHDVDLLRHLLGDIEQIMALPGASLRGTGRVESGAVALRMASGATVSISFADTAASPWGFEAGTGENPNIGTTGQDMLWITGTQGGISFPSMNLWHGTEWSQPATRQPLDVAQNSQTPLAAQLDHFIDVMEGAAPRIDVADATRTLQATVEIERQMRGS